MDKVGKAMRNKAYKSIPISGAILIEYNKVTDKYKIIIKDRALHKVPHYLGFIAKNHKRNMNNYYIHFLPRRLNNQLLLDDAIDLVIGTILEILGTKAANQNKSIYLYKNSWITYYV